MSENTKNDLDGFSLKDKWGFAVVAMSTSAGTFFLCGSVFNAVAMPFPTVANIAFSVILGVEMGAVNYALKYYMGFD